MPDQPADPFSGISSASVEMHEMFTSLQGAGFTETQALHIVTAIITTAVAAAMQGNGGQGN